MRYGFTSLAPGETKTLEFHINSAFDFRRATQWRERILNAVRVARCRTGELYDVRSTFDARIWRVYVRLLEMDMAREGHMPPADPVEICGLAPLRACLRKIAEGGRFEFVTSIGVPVVIKVAVDNGVEVSILREQHGRTLWTGKPECSLREAKPGAG